jgi:hypothetical protein
MDNIQKQSELLDNIKHKIKDGEYKMLMENLAEIKKKKVPQYVSFISIRAEARVKCGIFDGEKKRVEYEDISSKLNEDFDFDAGEEDEIVTNVSVTSHLVSIPLVRQVVDRDECPNCDGVRGCAYLPRNIYDKMKRQGYVNQGGEFLYFIEDL